jgi:sarcosine oxidase, subunit gamma
MLSRATERSTLVRVQSWARRERVVPREAANALRIEWPLQAGEVASGRAEVICINPTDWLVVAGIEFPEEELLQILAAAFLGTAFRATALSFSLARIRIEGDHARALLSKACALDTQSADLTPDRAPRTLVAGLPAIIRCLEGTKFECIVPLSYADYLMAWLGDAAAEFRVSVVPASRGARRDWEPPAALNRGR